MDWQLISNAPENVIVETKIDDDKGERNIQTLKRRGRLWWTPNGSMYVYYKPTHWRPAPNLYRAYRKTQITEAADWESGFDMHNVSVSNTDASNGSPKLGDKIARNPVNHADRWLIAKEYFLANFEML